MSTDDELDEALRETFPASDPPANTVETGVRLPVELPRPARDQPPSPRPERGNSYEPSHADDPDRAGAT